MKLRLVVNPVSGRGKGIAHGTAAARWLTSRGHDVIYFQGRNEVESRSFIAESVGHCDGLVVAGGDGLVHLAIQSLAGSATRLGIIPSGTGNDAARSLGIPLKDPIAAAALIDSDQHQSVDLGRATDHRAGIHWFLQVLSTGFDSVVNESANNYRWPKGRSKYNLAMLATLPRFSAIAYEMVIDGRVEKFDAMLVAIANGPSYGGGMLVCPEASFTDQQLDVMILHPLGKLKFLALFPRVYKGTHIFHPRVTTLRASSLTLTGDAVTYADGERIGPLPVAIQVIPDALKVWSRQTP